MSGITRSLQFAEGVTVSAPTQTNLRASSLAVYASDAAFVSAKGTGAEVGDMYFNTVDYSERVYGSAGWVDIMPGPGGIASAVVTSNATMSTNTSYICNSSSSLVLTLPATPSVGDKIEINSIGTGGWKLSSNHLFQAQRLLRGSFITASSSLSRIDLAYNNAYSSKGYLSASCVESSSTLQTWNVDTLIDSSLSTAYVSSNVSDTGKIILLGRQIITGEASYGTTAIPCDNTIPQITEGTQIFSLSVTPRKLGSTIVVRAMIRVTEVSNVASRIAAALFKDGASSAVSTNVVGTAESTSGTKQDGFLIIGYHFTSTSLSSIAFTVRIGFDASHTVYINKIDGQSSEFIGNYGNTISSWLEVFEEC